MKHTPIEIIDQCILRWQTCPENFEPGELNTSVDAAETIKAELLKEATFAAYPELQKVCTDILTWWEANKYNTTSNGEDEFNVYDDDDGDIFDRLKNVQDSNT